MIRSGFSLIEIIITIVIVAIIGGGSIQIVFNIYEAYTEKSELNRVDLTSLNSILQLSKLIENRVEKSIIVADTGCGCSANCPFNELNESEVSGSTKVLEWVGVDIDGFLGGWNSDLNGTLPAWSGFIDLDQDHNLSTTILGSENDFSLLKSMILSLSDSRVDISNNANPVAIFFKTGNYNNPKDGFGWYDSNSSGAYKVYTSNENFLSAEGNFSKISSDNFRKPIIYEQYQLSWTAYAVKLNDKDLNLYWNYQPWNGERYCDGEEKLLLKDVSSFTYHKIGSTIRLRVCIESSDEKSINRIGGKNIVCRENIIY